MKKSTKEIKQSMGYVNRAPSCATCINYTAPQQGRAQSMGDYFGALCKKGSFATRAYSICDKYEGKPL